MHADTFLREVAAIADSIDRDKVEKLAAELYALRERGGRLFLIGLGGSAANCSHAAADFRTLCDIDAYSLCDNFAAFSARANDESFEESFASLLRAMKLSAMDAVLILSVGGGTHNVSVPLINVLTFAKERRARIIGIVGPVGGHTYQGADCYLRIPSVNEKHVTPHTEAFQAVIWHCLVSHPSLQRNATKW